MFRFLKRIKFILECWYFTRRGEAPRVVALPKWCDADAPIFWAYAGGGRLHVYGNSQEAIEDSLSRGVKILEVDCNFTSDGVPVLTHEFRPNNAIEFDHIPSAQEFLAKKVNDRFTPLSLDSFLAKYIKDGGVFCAIDPGSAGGKGDLLEYMVRNVSVEVRQKIIYQTYSLQMASRAVNAGFASVHFGVHYIFSRKEFWRLRYLLPTLASIGVQSVSLQDCPMTESVVDAVKQIVDSGLVVSIAGIDSMDRIRRWMKCGVRCFNSRFVTPIDFQKGGF